MRRPSAVGSVVIALGLILATATPVAAEIPPGTGTLALQLFVVGDPGTPFDDYTGVSVDCVGNAHIGQDARATAAGWYEPVVSLGAMPVGTHCDLAIADPPTTLTPSAYLASTTFTPGTSFDIAAGENLVRIDFTYLPIQQGNLMVNVTVTGYTGGSWEPFYGTIGCEGMPENIEFGVGMDGPSGWLEMPVELPCWLMDFWQGDPGDGAEWGEIQFSDTGPWTFAPGDEAVVEVTVERSYVGEWPPEPDDWAEFGMELLTVDRVYLDRYGGISPEGRIFCPPPPEWPADGAIFANVNWDAIQYVGRKAVTASYQSSRAEICWEPGMTQPDTWQTYPRFTPDPGTTFIYSTNGKFASGTIHFEVYATGGYRLVTQNYDPSEALAPYDESCWDANGDGFCSVDIMQNKSIQANLKTTAVKPVRR